LDALAADPTVDMRIIMAASSLLHHYGNVIDDCPYPIANRIMSTLDGHTPETSAIETGVLTMQLATLFAQDKPDVVVTIADRHETLATAIAASYQNIPLAHVQGGEDTGNIDDRVRNAVSHLADIHFPATDKAAARLESLRVKGQVFQYGCPSVDLAARAIPDSRFTNTIIVLQHPVTNEVDHAREQVEETLGALNAVSNPVVWFWPGQDAGSEAASKRLREYEHTHSECWSEITFKRHLPASAFLSALRGCACLVGNSSVGIRECSYLGTPVIDIGTRQQGREKAANVYHAPHVKTEIARALRYQLDHGPYPQSTLYGTGDAGSRIARALADPASVGVEEALGCRSCA
jgi:UDP-hydrolysing UDP-N-acetyl-D-glucosamine 2-epimerase